MANKFLARNRLFYKVVIIILASVASLGTIPYGYKFTYVLALNSHFFSIFIGFLLAISAGIANMALGAYSLLNIKIKYSSTKPIYLFFSSMLSAIPIGFICYFAYQNTFPFIVNFLFSCIVAIINMGIAYTAILNFIQEVKINALQKISVIETMMRIIGLMIGFIVSLTIFVASLHGFLSIFMASKWNHQIVLLLAYFIGFLTWVPLAALYSNAMQVAAAKLYQLIKHFSFQNKKVASADLFIFILACCSGASFAQIAMDFFNPNMNIPHFLKMTSVQYFIYHFFIPFAFISSAAVNYFALKNLLNLRKNNEIK